MLEFCKRHAPKIALLTASFIWGITFPMGKYVIAHLPVFTYLAIRFCIAALLMYPSCRVSIAAAGRHEWGVALVIGFMLFGAFAFQTVGLDFTTAAKTSFATGLYVVFTPFLYFLIYRTPLRGTSIAAGVLGVVGITLLGGDFSGLLDWDFGVTLVLVSAIFTSLQIVGVGRYARAIDPGFLTIVQIGMVSAGSAVLAVSYESWPAEMPGWGVWGSVLFLAMFATVFAYFVQCRVQQHISHTATAVILSMECVFGALLSFIFMGDPFTLAMIIGGVLLVLAMIVAQFEPSSESA